MLTGLSVLRMLAMVLALLRPHPPVMSSLIFIIATLMSIAAAAMLFRSDALHWFGASNDVEEPIG